MGIINKPNTFTGQSDPQLPWLDANFDVLMAEFNGNIDNANIKVNAAIAQAKIFNLLTDLAAKLSLDGGLPMTGTLTVSGSLGAGIRVLNDAPTIYLENAVGAVEWLIQVSSNQVNFFKSTLAPPAHGYVLQYTLNPVAPTNSTDLTNKAYVDAAAAAAGRQILFSVMGSLSAGQTTFSGMLGGIGAEANFFYPVAIPGTFKRLFVVTQGAQPPSGSLVLTMRKNGADTGLVVTIPAGSLSDGTFSNIVNTVTFAEGERHSWQAVNNSTGTSASMRIGMEFDPA